MKKQLKAESSGEEIREETGLVVWLDDQPDAIDAYKQLLINHDFEVILFEFPLELLTWLKDQENLKRVDVLIIDLLMPSGGEGHQELRNIAQKDMGFSIIKFIQKSGINIPIIIASASVGQSEESQKLEEFGISKNNFLSKPINPKRLLTLVKNVCLK